MTSRPYDITSQWHHVPMTSRPNDNMSLWHHVPMTSCPNDILSLWHHVPMTSCPSSPMTSQWCSNENLPLSVGFLPSSAAPSTTPSAVPSATSSVAPSPTHVTLSLHFICRTRSWRSTQEQRAIWASNCSRQTAIVGWAWGSCTFIGNWGGLMESKVAECEQWQSSYLTTAQVCGGRYGRMYRNKMERGRYGSRNKWRKEEGIDVK